MPQITAAIKYLHYTTLPINLFFIIEHNCKLFPESHSSCLWASPTLFISPSLLPSLASSVYWLWLHNIVQVFYPWRQIIFLGQLFQNNNLTSNHLHCCIWLLRIYGLAVVISVRLACWLWVLECNSERIGHCGRSPTNSTRNLTSLLHCQCVLTEHLGK